MIPVYQKLKINSLNRIRAENSQFVIPDFIGTFKEWKKLFELLFKNINKWYEAITRSTENNVARCSIVFASQIQDFDLAMLRSSYGKGFPKKKRLSPDGYIQMAMQLAYYRMHKTIPKTYEPSMGRYVF